MAILNVFEQSTTDILLDRLSNLNNDTKPQWGKMNASQMLAHVNIGYDIAYGKTPIKYNFFMKFMLKMFVKETVVGSKPYKKNGGTAPVFVVSDERDFEKEKAQFIEYIRQTQSKGAAFFEGKESPAFGKLTSSQWNIQFYKHIDHHFRQFGI